MIKIHPFLQPYLNPDDTSITCLLCKNRIALIARYQLECSYCKNFIFQLGENELAWTVCYLNANGTTYRAVQWYTNSNSFYLSEVKNDKLIYSFHDIIEFDFDGDMKEQIETLLLFK